MRGALLASVAACCTLAYAPAWAQSARSYNIPGGELSRALREFMRQTDSQVLFLSGMSTGRRSPGFSGPGTAVQVLNRLLEGSGLDVRVANANTFLIVRAQAARPAAPTSPRPTAQLPSAATDPESAPLPPAQVDQVVVTATRLAEPASRVPLSITATTQHSLDQSGIRVFADFPGAAPALQASQTSSGVANVVLRGIANTNAAATAATTGFYLDDTPIHKRNAGGFINNNGTPLPPLFDLDRVEILRGPQGTLFGASSEGGTIRYITPQPSLSKTSIYLRSEASLMKDGDASFDSGVAFGAPIVRDRLGFRASVYDRQSGGYIDYIDPFTRNERIHNANGGSTRMLRLAVAWAPTADTRITAAYFTSAEHSASNVSFFTLPTTTPIVEQPICFNTSGITPDRPNPNPLPVSCGSAGVTFRREGATYGPYPDLKPYDLLTSNDRTPTKTHIQAPSLTIERRFDDFTLRSITSYVDDQTRSQQFALSNELVLKTVDALYAPVPPSTLFPAGGEFRQGLSLFAGLPTAGRQGAPLYGFGYGENKRYGISQELRASSAAEARPVSWVAGVFYSNMHGVNRWYVLENQELISQAFYGMTATQRYGIPTVVDPNTGLPYLYDRQDSFLEDIEIAAFGEANIWITPKLRLTAGLRGSRVQFSYSQAIWGAAAGFAVATAENRGLSSGRTAESPVTPKAAALYQFDDDHMIYATAAKGFRPGGVNPALSPALCDPVLSRFGLSSADVPATYRSDSVWSYEAGGKFRLFDQRLQLSADAYRINWSDIQTAVNFQGCGSPFITNVGGGRIGGAELEAEARFGAFSLEASVGYTHARYTEQATSPAGQGAAPLTITLKGQPLPTPPWTLKLGGRYETALGSDARFYVRGDWRWTSGYAASVYGVPAYSPDTAHASSVSRVNIRIGIERGGFDLALFATNLLNSHDGNVAGGRIGCTVAGGPQCTTFVRYDPLRTVSWGVPRQIGLQLAYRR